MGLSPNINKPWSPSPSTSGRACVCAWPPKCTNIDHSAAARSVQRTHGGQVIRHHTEHFVHTRYRFLHLHMTSSTLKNPFLGTVWKKKSRFCPLVSISNPGLTGSRVINIQSRGRCPMSTADRDLVNIWSATITPSTVHIYTSHFSLVPILHYLPWQLIVCEADLYTLMLYVSQLVC